MRDGQSSLSGGKSGGGFYRFAHAYLFLRCTTITDADTQTKEAAKIQYRLLTGVGSHAGFTAAPVNATAP